MNPNVMYSLKDAEKEIKKLNEEVSKIKKQLEDMTGPEQMRHFMDAWKKSDEYKKLIGKK